MVHDTPIGAVGPRAYAIPTDVPEADATMARTSTTMVTVEVEAGGRTGFGYTCGMGHVAAPIQGRLAEVLHGRTRRRCRRRGGRCRALCAPWGAPVPGLR